MSPPCSELTAGELLELHSALESVIEERLGEFRGLWNQGSDEDIFAELVFCLLTPQSKALSCWGAVECLGDRGLMLKGTKEEIAVELRTRTRFHNQKALNVVTARDRFTREGRLVIREILDRIGGPYDLREWLVAEVRGLGYKEASHFLRNIGKGGDLAILDRHILRNLVALGVIDETPASLSPKRYREIEEKMQDFCREIGMRMDHLDLVLWHRQTGRIFK